jgi:acrylyl-CoA reductase (NADPH)
MKTFLRPLRARSARLASSRGFRAVVARFQGDVSEGEAASRVLEFDSCADLPKQDPHADVEVAITHSDLNYKDAMIVLGQKGVVRGNGYPIVAGIDYAGTVVRSSNPLWKEGDSVVLTGNKAGQFFDGGYSERATVRGEWLVGLPPTLTLAQSMAIGTAGITAAQCISYLESHGEVKPSHGPVLVTGAAGGLGQLAVPMLRSRGFEVVASTGRKSTLEAHLKALGATEVIDRLDPNTKPLAEQKWAGVVDTVGGATLGAALAQTKYRGALACPGVAGGGELNATVYPLILRGVRLLGVDQTLPWGVEGYPSDPERWKEWRNEKVRMWDFVAEHLSDEALRLTGGGTIGLDDLVEYSPKIINGQVAGRVVVEVGKTRSDATV